MAETLLENMLRYHKKRYAKKLQEDKKRVAEEDKKRAERLRLIREEREKAEHERWLQELEEAAKRHQADIERKKQEDEERMLFSRFNSENYGGLFDQQEEQVRVNGVRYVKCELCGQVKPEDEFSTYGGMDHVNLGICYNCMRAKRKMI